MFKSDSIRGLSTFLRGVIAKIEDQKPINEVAGPVLAEEIEKQVDNSFRRSVAPDGTPWAYLRYVRPKKYQNRYGPPLVRTGKLWLRILALVREHKDDPQNIPLTWAALGYGYLHQFGNQKGPYPVARPFLGVSQQTVEKSGEAIAQQRAVQIELFFKV